jgi:quercetin dioxygenase-like cupin family protein
MKTKNFIKRLCGVLLIGTLSVVFLLGRASAQTSRDSTKSTAAGGFFTGGSASVNRIPVVPEINCGVAKVSFPPGVRTIWHSHAGGQIIVVVSGTAWYQEKGKPKQVIKQGESVVCPPNVMHWHGATPDGPMAHMVVTPNMDKGGATSGPAVTEKEYKSL